MLARSPSNRGAALCVILACAIAPPCFADGVQPAQPAQSDQPADPLLRYKTIGGMQGMYEVREEASKFLKRQPPPAQGEWAALLPDVRTFVPTCAVPFRTRWAVASDREEGMPGVMVICAKSTDKKYKKWDAFVGAGAAPKSGAKK
jgi:hypothetical protein